MSEQKKDERYYDNIRKQKELENQQRQKVNPRLVDEFKSQPESKLKDLFIRRNKSEEIS